MQFFQFSEKNMVTLKKNRKPLYAHSASLIIIFREPVIYEFTKKIISDPVAALFWLPEFF